eukprot:Pgem_evm1s17787
MQGVKEINVKEQQKSVENVSSTATENAEELKMNTDTKQNDNEKTKQTPISSRAM